MGPISAVVGDLPNRVVATLAAIVQKLSPDATRTAVGETGPGAGATGAGGLVTGVVGGGVTGVVGGGVTDTGGGVTDTGGWVTDTGGWVTEDRGVLGLLVELSATPTTTPATARTNATRTSTRRRRGRAGGAPACSWAIRCWRSSIARRTSGSGVGGSSEAPVDPESLVTPPLTGSRQGQCNVANGTDGV